MINIRYIPFLHIHPELKEEMIHAFEGFYDDQNYILGSGLEQFEREYATFNGVSHAIGVGNGHDALLIALKCLNIGRGDEVILPAHTFIATALAVVHAGAKPVLVDIDPHTFTIDPDQFQANVSKKTKAVIPVHIYGNPCDMIRISSIAEKCNVHVIEDNAQAQGAETGDRKTGSLGAMGITSFYPTKNIGALGDGGMITTNSDKLANRSKAYRNYGKSGNGNYKHIGLNSRLDELQAKLLSVKLRFLEKWNDDRIKLAGKYISELKDIRELQMQTTLSNVKNVHHIFPILTNKRDELRSFLAIGGVETLLHYEKPIHLHEAFRHLGHKKGSFPVAEYVCKNELSLPIYPGMSNRDIGFVCDRVRKYFVKNQISAG